jgi:hypothetical protein
MLICISCNGEFSLSQDFIINIIGIVLFCWPLLCYFYLWRDGCWVVNLALKVAHCSGGQNDDFRPLKFELYPGGEGHGVQGQICDILRPQLAMNRFLPLYPHRFPHFGYINLGGGGVGGSDIRSMSCIRPKCKCRCPPLAHWVQIQSHLS